MSDKTESIKEALGIIFSTLSAEKRDGYLEVSENEGIIAAKACAEKGEYEDFYYALTYPITKVVDGLLSTVTESSEAKFILKHPRFVELHFEGFIEKYEGSACCSDKSTTIMRGLLDYYMSGVEISFNREQEYTYHLPSLIFIDHEEILMFFEGVYRLYYGNPEAYLKSLNKIINRITSKSQAV